MDAPVSALKNPLKLSDKVKPEGGIILHFVPGTATCFQIGQKKAGKAKAVQRCKLIS
jgi:hypothetical protein